MVRIANPGEQRCPCVQVGVPAPLQSIQHSPKLPGADCEQLVRCEPQPWPCSSSSPGWDFSAPGADSAIRETWIFVLSC